MSDRLKLPPKRDFGFYQRRKHDKWREVPAPSPALEASVADSHAHVHMLPDPAWELARCAANGVDFICMIVDPSEDGSRPFDELDSWVADSLGALNGRATDNLTHKSENVAQNCGIPQNQSEKSGENATLMVGSASADQKQVLFEAESAEYREFVTKNDSEAKNSVSITPKVRIATGVHPHNARLYDVGMEDMLLERLADSRVVALGEIGLDYHYDLSPRDVQRNVFKRQIELAQRLGLPICLHLRGGEDPVADNAHKQAFDILKEHDALGPRTLLHCCTLSPDELAPWVDAGCYIAFGGAVTFKNADAAREGVRMVPESRLLFETDSPYMTPEPMRGATCTPAHIIFTAAAIAEMRGLTPGHERERFLKQVHDNTLSFYGVGLEG